MSGQNRTEQATPRRRQKARERGQVARSREISSALALLGLTMILKWLAPRWVDDWRRLFTSLLDRAREADLSLADSVFTQTAWLSFSWLAVPVAAVCAISVISLSAQGGIVIASEALSPDWNRLNPASNAKQFFSLGALSRLLKSLLPLAILIYLAHGIFTREWTQMANASGAAPGETFARSGGLLFEFAWKASLALLAWSAIDYAVQRAHLSSSLKMTKQEVKDEFKETEGNPAIKSRIKRLQRSNRRRRMLQDVEKATVVITNPTEYAVALRYVPAEMPAPVVVAKGRNALAARIKRIAYWSDVPVMENKPLARALYKAAEVGQTIPAALYTAVAEILAFLYRMRAPGAGAGRGPALPPGADATRN